MNTKEIFTWLKEQNFQTSEGEQEYTMYFSVDMPKILNKYAIKILEDLLARTSKCRECDAKQKIDNLIKELT